jgi:3,4-dihydroxy-2-butanone 4-phosphate synthase
MTERDPVMATVPEAIEEYRRGRFVIITDDEDRENEGDLCMAAQFVTPDAINFMAKYGRGLICCSITEDRCADLKLPLMVDQAANNSGFGTPFTVSVEARTGVTTGISAADRARTVQVLIDPTTKPDGPAPCRCSSTRRRNPRTSRVPATCFHCVHGGMVYWCGPDKRRQASTLRRWPACTRGQSSAKS